MSTSHSANIAHDEKQLHTISTLHYALAILSLFSILTGAYLAFGFSLTPEELAGSDWQWSDAYNAWFFDILVKLSGWIWIVLGLVLLILAPRSGYCIQRRQSRKFSLIVAGLSCLLVPLGTVVGIWTIRVLKRPSIRALYQSAAI